MKIIKKDLKKGRIVFRLEVADDLYYLADILNKDDRVISRTKRRIDYRQGIERAERLAKEAVTLEIQVETVEFDRTIDRLRVTGRIYQGPETVATGDFHTLNLRPGMVLTVTKDIWTTADLIKVEDASKAIKAKILLLAIEDGLCSFGLLREYGVKLSGTISKTLSGKKEPEKKRAEEISFFEDLLDAIENEAEGLDRIVIAGPAFYKDNFYKYFKEKKSELAVKAVIENVSTGGERGLQEIIKRGIIERIIKEWKVQQEVKKLTEFFEEFSKNLGLAVYGLKNVEYAMNLGAIKTLLISNSTLKKSKIEKNKQIDELLKNIYDMRGEILIVSNEHDLGKQLEGIGGLAALLRFRVEIVG
ncbi:TPA: mRNA surveillance protein pelota [archaeon]|uniref:Protein pelota homolog n=1 Tax=Candidatus Naiadarchaeum limnaeum TaxID=2756139 RepID=A0A832UUI6_9ARCH|nr:mRNA surveillance protein pelota [Candidatus Naiadarchaeales archaeon SRR2090153.bin1042]HIJ99949.1 mRNA surveillance protein pelota [Candidatus Naiadarchaeum limnaeum]